MPQYEVTHTRHNDTEDGSAPISTLTREFRAANKQAAIEASEQWWTENGAGTDGYTATAELL